MAHEILARDANYRNVVAGVTNDANLYVTMLRVDPSTKRLLVDASVTVSGLATAVTDGEAVDVADTGNLALGTDGSNYQILKTDSSGELQVDVLTMPTVTVQATNLDIRDLTSASDSVAAVQSGTWNITNVSGTISLPTGAATLAEQQTQTTALGTLLTSANFAAAFGTAGTADAQVMSIQGIASMTPVQIADGGNIITVDGTVTAELGATDNAVLDAIAASVAAIDTDATTIIGHVDGLEALLTTIDADTGNMDTSLNNIETAVQLIDDTIFTAGTDTYTETSSKGQLIVAVRRDADTTLANTTNEFVPLQVDANGYLKVEIFDGGGSHTVDGTVAVSSVGGTVAVTQSGTWDEVGINDSGNSITVDNGGTFVVQENGAALTALQLIDDIIFTAGTSTYTETTSKGGLFLAVRRDADTTLANTTNEMVPLQVDANGYLKVEIFDGGGSHTVDNNGTFVVQVDGAALTALQLIDNSIYVDDADWTADTSSHTLVGAVTQTTPTANTDGDTTPLITNNLRELRNAALESDLATAGTAHVKKYYTNAGAVTDGIIWSPAAGKRWFLTHLSINVSAAATVTIEDDLGAGDSAVYKAEFAANSGVVLTFPEVPMFSGEDAADLLVTTSAGNVYVTAVGYEI